MDPMDGWPLLTFRSHLFDVGVQEFLLPLTDGKMSSSAPLMGVFSYGNVSHARL